MKKMRLILYHVAFLCLTFSSSAIHTKRNNVKTIRKVSFTQTGYIQFLRYVTEVPPLDQYTFCLWVRSHNFTHSHPLLSYSKHEEERLIRVWISPHGTDINLEIVQEKVFRIPIKFKENHWYNVCQSWSAFDSKWNFYLNGKLKSSGYEPKLLGATIKGGGDIVIGQEYTDFDKGLDDGIEGDVFGFNFVLSVPQKSTRRYKITRYHQYRQHHHHLHSQHYEKPITSRTNTNPLQSRVIKEYTPKSTALRLVASSYNCFLGQGSPVKGEDVLISWTKTPVRVFGGATLKSISPFCI